MHLREGFIIPYQITSVLKPKTTRDLIEHVPITLIAFPTNEGVARGSLFIDDEGDSLHSLQEKDYQHFSFHYSSRI